MVLQAVNQNTNHIRSLRHQVQQQPPEIQVMQWSTASVESRASYEVRWPASRQHERNPTGTNMEEVDTDLKLQLERE